MCIFRTWSAATARLAQPRPSRRDGPQPGDRSGRTLQRNVARRPGRHRTPPKVRADQCRIDQNATADLKLAA
jgi:hypothetical protein